MQEVFKSADYTKTTIGKENRIELHEKLSLTGAEISLNELPICIQVKENSLEHFTAEDAVIG